jgi:hypothetical protein
MPHLDDTRTDLDLARMSGTFAGVQTFISDCYNSNDLEYRGWYSDKVTDWTTKESWFSYQQGQENSLQSIQTSYGAYPASCSLDTGALSVRIEWLGLEANHSHLVPRLRIYGATLPLPPYTFMACIETTLHLLCFKLKLVV